MKKKNTKFFFNETMIHIKEAFFDILFLYRNFLHWLKSKTVIFVFCFFAALIFSFLLNIFYSIWIDVSIIQTTWSMLSTVFLDSLISNILLIYANIGVMFVLLFKLDFLSIIYVLSSISFVFLFSYIYILMSKLNLEYIKNKKLKIKKNEYFNVKIFWRYMLLNLYNLWLLLIPTFIFSIFSVLLVLLYGWISNLNKLFVLEQINSFSIILFFSALFTLIFTIFVFYKIVYSYLILLEDKKYDKSVFTYLKKSFKITKWLKKFFKVIIVFSVFWLLLLPFNVFEKSIMMEINSISTYLQNKNNVDVKLIDSYFLESKYWKISEDELNQTSVNFQKILILFKIFKFVLFFWILNLLYVSTYKRIITKK